MHLAVEGMDGGNCIWTGRLQVFRSVRHRRERFLLQKEWFPEMEE